MAGATPGSPPDLPRQRMRPSLTSVDTHIDGLGRLPSGSRVVVSSTSSDAHTWNLVFLELLITHYGHVVHNLGPCVPVAHLVEECILRRPALLVLSSVNGHGVTDGINAIRAIRAAHALANLPVVIGGKLTTTGDLSDVVRNRMLDAGFDAVLTGPASEQNLRHILTPVSTMAVPT